jgi:hypothetical protein
MERVAINEALNVANDYFNLKISEEWLLENLDKISSHFPAADDNEYIEEYGPDDVWWTFEAECKKEALSDTSARERFADALAIILIGEHWPLYMDSDEKSDQFFQTLSNACDAQEGITLRD